jgi:hypothetical protein
MPASGRRVGEGIRRKVDKNTLPVAERRHANERPYSFDVATGFADEPPDIAVGELHLDGNGSATTLDSFDDYFVRLFRE